jgi:hypothetical protein
MSSRRGRALSQGKAIINRPRFALGERPDSAQSCFAAPQRAKNFYALYMYARTLLQSGKSTEAVSEFEKLLRGNDWSSLVMILTIKTLATIGRAYGRQVL